MVIISSEQCGETATRPPAGQLGSGVRTRALATHCCACTARCWAAFPSLWDNGLRITQLWECTGH